MEVAKPRSTPAIFYIEGLLPELRPVTAFSILLPILVRQIQNVSQRMIHQQLFIGTLRNDNSMRAVLLWVCMVGYAVTEFMKSQKNTQQEESAFETCYGLVLYNELAEGEVDAVEDELGLCETLPPSGLQLGASGETIFKRMIAELEGQQRQRKLSD